jgi:hypothetical protein
MGEISGLAPLMQITIGDDGSRHVDEMHREGAEILKAMIQMATLVALRARQHGHKQAQARGIATNAQVKETRERMVAQRIEHKAKDPRNAELGRMMDGTARWLAQQPRTVSLDRPVRATPAQARTPVQAKVKDTRTPYDSSARRDAVARNVYDAARTAGRTHADAQHLASVRHLLEMGQAQPAQVATRTVPGDMTRGGGVREIDGRGLARER